MPKDTILYDRLGVSADASESQIKKGFLSQSKQWHPDKHEEERKEEATQKFKDIMDAKEILLDENKRRLYDQVGIDMVKDAQRVQPENQHPFGGNPFGGGFPFGGMPGMPPGFPFGGFTQQPSQPSTPTPQPIRATLTVSLEQIILEETIQYVFACTKECISCNGEGGVKTRCEPCRGQGKTVSIQQIGPMIQQMITPCQHCRGTGTIVQQTCKICDGKCSIEFTKKIPIPLKNTIRSNDIITLSREGNRFRDQYSDVLITLVISPHHLYKINHYDLYQKIDLTLTEALFGFQKGLSLLDGRTITVKATTKTDPFTVMSLPGYGVNRKGTLFIVFGLLLPTLSPAYSGMFNEVIGSPVYTGEQDTVVEFVPVVPSISCEVIKAVL